MDVAVTGASPHIYVIQVKSHQLHLVNMISLVEGRMRFWISKHFGRYGEEGKELIIDQ